MERYSEDLNSWIRAFSDADWETELHWKHENFEYRFPNTKLIEEHHLFGPLALFNYYVGLFTDGNQFDHLKIFENYKNDNNFDFTDIKVQSA